MSVVEFKRVESGSVAECLSDTEKLNLREVVIIGVSDDDEVYLTHSTYKSTLKIIGAIEMLKMYVWSSWHNGD